MSHIIVIGAGIGGLTAGALLLKAGHQVTILEAQVYPGGSAGTYYHKGYRFDAGATLAGGFSAGGPHARLAEKLGLTWPVKQVDPAWVVHLPGGQTVIQWTDPERWQQEWQAAFPETADFWKTQEMLADIAWDVSSRPFPWPPQTGHELLTLAKAIRPKTLKAAPYLFKTVADLTDTSNPDFLAFLNGQLLISAQTTAEQANALYGSAALDLPRRGVNHVQGGIGSLAETLVDWITDNGGEVLYRQRVEKIFVRNNHAVEIITNKNLEIAGDYFLANLTPWALHRLLQDAAPKKLRDEVKQRHATWGAFTLYLGLNSDHLPAGMADHHQVIMAHKQPLGEGNSVFISLSDPADERRAPAGKRAATLSTHTDISPWWQLREGNKGEYDAWRNRYAEKLLNAAEQAIPGFKNAVELCLPGTPITFEFYTGRPKGMVGGFPQKSLFDVRGPGTGIPNLWLVGDSIFPGQSTAGVTLGGMRVADAIIKAVEKK
jgi:C-3',4' desaturase CrtD